MDYEKLARLARMMEPFEKASKMIEPIPAAVRLAGGLPRANPAISNLNRMQELTGKTVSASSQWKMNGIHSNNLPLASRLPSGNQQAMALALELGKLSKFSNLAATAFLDSFKASSLVVSKAVLEFTERNRILHEKVTKHFKLLPEAFIVLGDHGWYLNLEFELGRAVQLLEMLQAGGSQEVDEYLVAYFKSELLNITQELIIRHPKRKSIFEEIVFCVEHKKYFTAIPTVLSQVDGICSDMIKMKFFSKDHKRDHKPKISVYISDQFPLAVNFFFAPIMDSPVIMLSENDARNHPFQINRHTVMHGLDVKYGTEVNFYKCFSLLKYLSDVLFELEEEAVLS